MSEATKTEAASLARLQQMFEENVVPKLASEKGLTNPPVPATDRQSRGQRRGRSVA